MDSQARMHPDVSDDDDSALLKAYAQGRDERAFRRLVERHVDLVYSAARRQSGGDAHLAEDVVQAVFIVLARRAGTVRSGAVLPAWLLQTTRNVARAALRSDARRRKRELHVAEMTRPFLTPDDPQNAATAAEANDAARAAEAVLDDALARLSERDRTLVTLRYLKGLSISAIAAATGASEAAAQRQVLRAVGKMRDSLARRGVVLPAALVAAVLGRSVQAAPAGLASRVASSALSAHASVAAVGWAVKTQWAIASLLNGIRAHALFTAIATTLALAAIAAATASAIIHRIGPQPSASIAPGPVRKAGPVRVGIYVSAATGIKREKSSGGIWYDQFKIVEEFASARPSEVELIPIIEPGTADQPKLKRFMGKYFPGKVPLNVMSAPDLQRVDVILGSMVHEPPSAALESIERAVRGGTGLFVRRCLGACSPGKGNRTVREIYGISLPVLSAAPPKPVECDIVGSHPILGDLSGEIDRTLSLRVAGLWGTLATDGSWTPLIRIKQAAETHATTRHATPGKPNFTGTTGDVLYAGAIGSGRVVVGNFFNTTPPELMRATDDRFNVLVVQWLAGRDVK